MDEIRIRLSCGDCGAPPGELHIPGCDREPCPRCGGQLISCACIYEVAGLDPDRLEIDHPDVYREGPTLEMDAAWDAAWGGRRIRWSGEPHGYAECRSYGFWALSTPAGLVPMPASTPGVEEDLEALFARCRWDADSQRFVLLEGVGAP